MGVWICRQGRVSCSFWHTFICFWGLLLRPQFSSRSLCGLSGLALLAWVVPLVRICRKQDEERPTTMGQCSKDGWEGQTFASVSGFDSTFWPESLVFHGCYNILLAGRHDVRKRFSEEFSKFSMWHSVHVSILIKALEKTVVVFRINSACHMNPFRQ